jgi:hypothetical protein
VQRAGHLSYLSAPSSSAPLTHPSFALTSTFPNAIVLEAGKEAIFHSLLLHIELLLADGSTVSRWDRKCRREFNGLSLNIGM